MAEETSAANTFPGLTPITKKLAELQPALAQLEADQWELKQIRRRLLTKLGKPETDATKTIDLFSAAHGE
jgi:hypothetical protein